jgi:hypothetical protein
VGRGWLKQLYPAVSNASRHAIADSLVENGLAGKVLEADGIDAARGSAARVDEGF